MMMIRRLGNSGPAFYDFYGDWDLIEASIAQQYGIRIRQEIDTISRKEVLVMIKGLLPETPLGKIIQIRSENDKDRLKEFTPEMKKTRNEWRKKQANDKLKDEQQLETTFDNMDKMLQAMFG